MFPASIQLVRSGRFHPPRTAPPSPDPSPIAEGPGRRSMGVERERAMGVERAPWNANYASEANTFDRPGAHEFISTVARDARPGAELFDGQELWENVIGRAARDGVCPF